MKTFTCLADAVKHEARCEMKLETDAATARQYIATERDKLPKNKDGLILASTGEFKAFRDVYKITRMDEYLRKHPDDKAAATMSRKTFTEIPDGSRKAEIAERRERVFNFRDQAFSRLMRGKLAKNGKKGPKGKAKPDKTKLSPSVAKIAKVTATDEPLLLALKWAATDGKSAFLKWAASEMPADK